VNDSLKYHIVFLDSNLKPLDTISLDDFLALKQRNGQARLTMVPSGELKEVKREGYGITNILLFLTFIMVLTLFIRSFKTGK
jgi:hypothetical protein